MFSISFLGMFSSSRKKVSVYLYEVGHIKSWGVHQSNIGEIFSLEYQNIEPWQSSEGQSSRPDRLRQDELSYMCSLLAVWTLITDLQLIMIQISPHYNVQTVETWLCLPPPLSAQRAPLYPLPATTILTISEREWNSIFLKPTNSNKIQPDLNWRLRL